jgi:hypothetical protein
VIDQTYKTPRHGEERRMAIERMEEAMTPLQLVPKLRLENDGPDLGVAVFDPPFFSVSPCLRASVVNPRLNVD